VNENEKGFDQGQQGGTTGQDKNRQFGQDQQTETGQGQQNQEFGQDKSQQLGQDKSQQLGQDPGQPAAEGSAFFGEGKPGEQGQQGQPGEQGQSAWPEKGRREDEETGAGSGDSPDKSGGRY
jgi:hypothetical protein